MGRVIVLAHRKLQTQTPQAKETASEQLRRFDAILAVCDSYLAKLRMKQRNKARGKRR